jgi:hypothetical protein
VKRLLAAGVAAVLGCLSLAAPAAAGEAGSGFVTRYGSRLMLEGKQFRFAGSNNYYLMYKSRTMVDDVFADGTSNVADVVVTVKPDPGAAIRIASWETGTEGWAPGNWQANAGTLTQTADFQTDGSLGLHVDAVEGGWFGVTLAEPLDLSAKSTVRFDLRTGPGRRHLAQRGPAGGPAVHLVPAHLRLDAAGLDRHR